MAASIESRLPTGGRPRQLRVRTLLIGMSLVVADGRPAHLSRVHHTLVALPTADRRRLGVDVDWRNGPHTLTYRQVERTFALVTAALANHPADGTASKPLCTIIDALLEASIPDKHKTSTTALAVDWSDMESFARPATSSEPSADPEASWGHRRGNGPGQRHESFYGYYLQTATMVREEDRPATPELVRRMLLTSCHVDPPAAFVAVLQRMVASGIGLGDVLADSGYAHRVAQRWALPLRRLGATLVHDLHPHDRGPKGTWGGAIAANGNLYCPATPTTLLELTPLPPQASREQTAAHDTLTAEAHRYRLGRLTANDPDGYHRVACPALANKLRCPLRPNSISLPHNRPEILEPPETAPPCCTQQSLTVPPDINAKTAQKHPYPSAAWRRSYRRRTSAERGYSTIKDPATTNTTRGWCRLTGLCAITLFLACALIARNQRILNAFDNRQADNARRLANGLPPHTRRRRRRTLTDLAATTP